MKKNKRPHRKIPSIDLSPYKGEWVALHPKTHAVVSHHLSFREAEQAAVAAGVAQPLLMPVPKSAASFVGRS